MLAPLRDPRLIAAYVAGFGVLFSLVSSFTYVTFRLDAEPFGLGPTPLSMLFVVYLLGLFFTPLGGRALDTRGHLWVMCVGMGASMLGVLLTLPDWLPTIVVGLGAASCGVFVAQAAASSFVGARATAGRAGASGLYLTAYYLGGSVGAVAPAGLWEWGGWPAVATLTIGVQLLVVMAALTGWRGVHGAPKGD
jgi:MFS family permease